MFAFTCHVVLRGHADFHEGMTFADTRENPLPPVCRCCQKADRVSPVPLVTLEPHLEYWRCDRCGYVWGTRDGEPTSA